MTSTHTQRLAPAAAVQAFLRLAFEDDGGEDACAWVAALDEAARRS